MIGNIKKAEMRFQQVRRHPNFAEFESQMLTERTARVQAATIKMAERYRNAMDAI